MEISDTVASSNAEEVEAISRKLEELYREAVHAFPYADIRHMGKTVTSRKKLMRRAIKKGFIPDLAMYFADIAGCSNWGMKSLEWSFEKRQKLTEYLSKGFFEQCPEYLPVRRWITASNTPELYRDFVLHEEMRVNVLALIGLLNQLEND